MVPHFFLNLTQRFTTFLHYVLHGIRDIYGGRREPGEVLLTDYIRQSQDLAVKYKLQQIRQKFVGLLLKY